MPSFDLGCRFPLPSELKKKKKKKKKNFGDCLGDRELDDLDEGAHAKTRKQVESYTEI